MVPENLDILAGKLGMKKLGRPALAGIVLAVVMVAASAGINLASAATATTFEPSPYDTNGFIARSSSSGSSEEAEATSQETVFVHVAGAVKTPGLYELDASSRIADAVICAGGLSDDAAPDAVNLAQKVADGMKVQIPTVEEAEQGNGSYRGNGVGSKSFCVNINTASAAQLQELPGIGPSLAQKVIADRERNGPFSSVDDLSRVSGIGKKKLESLEGLITV